MRLKKATAITIISVLPFSFGCGPKIEEIEIYGNNDRWTTTQQGITDREWLKQQGETERKLLDLEQIKKAVAPVPEKIPMITTVTKVPGAPEYDDDLGMVPGDDETITETRPDTVAIALVKLGEANKNITSIAMALANSRQGSPRDKVRRHPERIIYQRPIRPSNSATEIITATGDAVKNTGIVSAFVSSFLAWMTGTTVREIVKTPSHTGDYVRLDNSYNPITTTTTAHPTQGSE